MELRHHQCLDPSTLLSPSVPIEECEARSRVLQELCGNSRHEYGERDPPDDRKASNTLPSDHHHYSSLGLTNYANSYHPALRRYGLEKRRERSTEREFQALWRRLQENEGYQTYRKRQPCNSERGMEKESKWPDFLEVAFFRALVEFPPMGRKMLKHGSWPKARGRNELIMDYIKRTTGFDRDRKQISSHLQVLRPYIENDPKILWYMPKNKKIGKKRDPNARTRRTRSMQRPAPEPFTPLASNSTPPLPYSLSIEEETDQMLSGLHIQSSSGPPSHPMPRSFKMHIRTERQSASLDEAAQHVNTHTYTEFASNARLPDMCIDEAVQVYPSLPLFTCPSNCAAIFLFEASVDLFLGDMPPNSDLSIALGFDRGHTLDASKQFVCRTLFFGSGSESTDLSAKRLIRSFQDEVLSEEKDACSIPFGSKFWAHTLYTLARKVKGSSQLGSSSGESMLDIPDRVRSQIRNTTAVQEIYEKVDDDNDSSPEPIVVIFWKFRQTRPDEPGLTYWRRLYATTSPTNKEEEDIYSPDHLSILPYPCGPNSKRNDEDDNNNNGPIDYDLKPQHIDTSQSFDTQQHYVFEHMPSLPAFHTDIVTAAPSLTMATAPSQDTITTPMDFPHGHPHHMSFCMEQLAPIDAAEAAANVLSAGFQEHLPTASGFDVSTIIAGQQAIASPHGDALDNGMGGGSSGEVDAYAELLRSQYHAHFPAALWADHRPWEEYDFVCGGGGGGGFVVAGRQSGFGGEGEARVKEELILPNTGMVVPGLGTEGMGSAVVVVDEQDGEGESEKGETGTV